MPRTHAVKNSDDNQLEASWLSSPLRRSVQKTIPEEAAFVSASRGKRLSDDDFGSGPVKKLISTWRRRKRLWFRAPYVHHFDVETQDTTGRPLVGAGRQEKRNSFHKRNMRKLEKQEIHICYTGIPSCADQAPLEQLLSTWVPVLDQQGDWWPQARAGYPFLTEQERHCAHQSWSLNSNSLLSKN
jgi:hypothetical protein